MYNELDPEMISWIGDEDPGRRSVAADYLGRIGNTATIDLLQAAARNERDEWVFGCILCAATELSRVKRNRLLRKMLQEITDDYKLFTFLLFVGEYRVGLPKRLISTFLDHPEWFVRLAATRFLLETQSGANVENVLQGIRQHLLLAGLGEIKPDVSSFQGYEVLYSKSEALRRTEELIVDRRWTLMAIGT